MFVCHEINRSSHLFLGRAEAIQAATMMLKMKLFSCINMQEPSVGDKHVQFNDSDFALYQLRVRTKLVVGTIHARGKRDA